MTHSEMWRSYNQVFVFVLMSLAAPDYLHVGLLWSPAFPCLKLSLASVSQEPARVGKKGVHPGCGWPNGTDRKPSRLGTYTSSHNNSETPLFSMYPDDATKIEFLGSHPDEHQCEVRESQHVRILVPEPTKANRFGFL